MSSDQEARDKWIEARNSALSPTNANEWHVLQAVSRDVARDDPVNADLDFDKFVTGVTAGQLPPAIISYISSKDITALNDQDKLTPTGAFWEGASGATAALESTRPIVFNTDWLVLDKTIPGLGEAEAENARKIGRLSGMPVGVWVNPSGWYQQGRESKFDGTDYPYDRLLEAVRAWLWACSQFKGRGLPYRLAGRGATTTSVQVKSGSYKRRMSRIPGDRHKGMPSHGSGANRAEIGHGCNLGVQLKHGYVSYEELAAFFASEVGIPPYLTEFFRFQGGQSPILSYRYDAQTNWPLAVREVQYEVPKVRSILAASMWFAAGQRETVGEQTDLMKGAPFHQTLPEMLWGYLTEVLRISGLRIQDVKSLDRKKFDQNFSAQLFRATGEASAELFPVFKRFLHPLQHQPVLGHQYQPGFVGSLQARDRGMPSGVPQTNAWDGVANGAVHLESLACVTGKDVWHWAADLVAFRHAFICSGDDTVALLPKGVHLDDYLTASKKIGLETKVQHYIQYLAKAFSYDGVYTNIVTRLIQNTLFKERRFVTKDVDIHRLGIITNRSLLTDHPYKAVYDAFLRAVVDDASIDALTMTVDDIAPISKRLRRRALDQASLREMSMIEGKLAGLEAGSADLEGQGSDNLTFDLLDGDWSNASMMFDINEMAEEYFYPWRESAAALVKIGQRSR